ncbi:MFS transporter, putative metabolite:H+ symporter [Paracoccus solventivorans]|uniref:MFS transporter, putative metabolite:H+ symporter n=1 Tax=Paracoccus solventivorans TaxID=53463 RepID=A0A1M7GBU5_9RHOB|nr:MFS transporter [Paracoccus solventivorans]SHM13701.1 MFS transporter, putative metabolite:H+ symporter [Paracoccus solventivorans]
MNITVDDALSEAGAGRFQRRLMAIFGLVWAADAMQVVAVGFAAPSIAASFGLDMRTALQSGTLFFLGMFLGAALFGRLADRVGRRNVLIVTVACDAVFGLASAFSPDFQWLLALRFLTGAAVGGTLPVDYAMMAEFLPPKNRGRWLVWLEGFWALGTLIVALTAWAAATWALGAPWKLIYIVAALPACIGIFLRLWVPESPMYLLRRDREPQARAIINRVRVANGAPALPEGARLILPPTAPTPAGGILAPGLARTTLAVLSVWFLVSLSYYGVFVWLPGKLATEGFGFVRGYGFLVVLALAQLPGYALAAWGVDNWGRQRTLRIFLMLSALGCLAFVTAGSALLVAGALMLMSFALLGTWGALYALTPEVYPTTLRATGMGMAGAIARLGGLAAPSVLAVLATSDFNAMIGLFAALLVLAAVLSFAIGRETRGVSIA